MYVGVLTVIFGWAVLYQSPAVTVYGLAISLCFYSFVVFFEEPILSKRFGAEYEHALKFLDGYSCDAAGLLTSDAANARQRKSMEWWSPDDRLRHPRGSPGFGATRMLAKSGVRALLTPPVVR
jgi:Phospholipid methyltransferase